MEKSSDCQKFQPIDLVLEGIVIGSVHWARYFQHWVYIEDCYEMEKGLFDELMIVRHCGRKGS